MRSTKNLWLAATTLLATFTSTACARDFETSNQNIRVIFRPLKVNGVNGTRISCSVTLEGTFHYRTTSKAVFLIGYITRAISETNSCLSADPTGIRMATSTETLPWHLTCVDFEGTLPAARPRTQINNMKVKATEVPLLGICTFIGNPRYIVTGPAGGGINEGAASIIMESGVVFNGTPIGCPRGTFEGRAPVTALGTTTPVTVRLI